MAAKTGRSYQMSHSHRDKIKNSGILNRLIKHAEGKLDVDGIGLEAEMTQSQVTAALALLKKVMPDLQPIDPDSGAAGLTIHLHQDAKKV